MALSPVEALAADRRTQPGAAVYPVWHGPTLADGDRVLEYTSPFSATVALGGGGQKAVVESTADPIAQAAPGSASAFEPLDLSLEPDRGGWKPARGSTPVRIPRAASDAVQVGRGIALRIDAGAANSSTGVLDAGGRKVFFHDVADDTDSFIETVPRGVSVSWVLRSPRAPERLRFDLAGVSASSAADGSLVLKSGDEDAGTVSAPIAVDAQGTPVDVKFEIQQGRAFVVVAHRKADIAYPISVDPLVQTPRGAAVVDEQSPGQPQWIGWTWETFGGAIDQRVFPSLGVFGFYFPEGRSSSGHVWWKYPAVRASGIFKAEYPQVNFGSSGNTGTCVQIGLWAGGGADPAYTRWADDSGASGEINGAYAACNGWSGYRDISVCADYYCEDGGSPGNVTFYLMSAVTGGNAGAASSYSNGAFVWHRDRVAPTSSFVWPYDNWSNFPGGLSLTADISDAGEGTCGNASYGFPSVLRLADPATGTALGEGWINELDPSGFCTGQTNYGPGYASGRYTATIPRSTLQSIEGIRVINVDAYDLVGNRAPNPRTARIDLTAPRVTVGGRLGAFATTRDSATSPLPGEIRTLTGPADVTIGIKDSRPDLATSGTHSSGVVTSSARLIKLRDDNKLQDTAFAPIPLIATHPACAGSDDCDRDPVRTAITDAQLAPGLYQVEVSATDRAGNQTAAYYVFGKGGGEITTVAEGQGTARWVPLQAKRTTGAPNFATFEWRTGKREWAAIPGESLFDESTNAAVNSAQVRVVTGLSGRYVLDVEQLIRAVNRGEATFTDLKEGRLQLRAVFDGAGTEYERKSEDVAIHLDRGGRDTSDETTAMGAGSVDLLTGNFALSAVDASLSGYQSGVSLQRTYGSRYVSKVDGSRFSDEEDGMLGPGWTMALPADGLSDFVRAVDLNDPARDAFVDRWDQSSPTYDAAAIPEERYGAVRVETADGSGFTFERQAEYVGGVQVEKYVPELGFENYSLSRASSDGGATASRFALTDRDADTVTTFGVRQDDASRPVYDGQPEHGTFGVTSIDTPGIAGKPAWRYEKKGTQFVPTRAVAAHDGSLSCPLDGTLARGCQALDLDYQVHGPTGRYRLVSASLSATEPTTGVVVSKLLVSYGYDAAGRLVTVKDERAGLAVSYGYDQDGILNSITPPGEAAHAVSYQPQTDDKTKGRLRTASRTGISGSWTVLYSDNTLGGAKPADLSTDQVKKWGQVVTPFRTAAVIPPDVPFGVDTATLQKASISYLDALGREINHAEPGGRISATDYDKWGNVTRSLTPAARAAAVAAGTTLAVTQDAANRRATITTYADDGRGARRPVKGVGPERDVQLASGAPVRGRSLTVTGYDTNLDGTPFAPSASMPYNLPTVVRSGAVTGMDALGNGGTEQAMRVEKTQYQLTTRQPLAVVSDAGGPLENTRRFILDADGKEVERRQPSKPGTAAATNFAAGSTDATNAQSTTRTTYYSTAAPTDPTVNPLCGGRPEWVGLPCEVSTGGAQPTSGIRKLPVKRFEYDVWRRPVKVVETVTSATGVTETRTTASTFDAKDRPVDETITGNVASVGGAIDTVRHVYSDVTGRETETLHIDKSTGKVLRKVKRSFDGLGRLWLYENLTADAAGTTFTVDSKEQTTYDEMSRPATVTDYSAATALATKTYGYDATTGYLTSLKDSGLDPLTAMTAVYDLDGRPTSVIYPSGVTKGLEYDEAGFVKRMSYTKTSGCSTACLWYENKVTRSPHGQIVGDTSTLAARTYGYDSLGRLTTATDTPAGAACTARAYTYDANSNRLTRRSGASCTSPTTGGSVVTSTYDAADRMTAADGYGLAASTGGVTYDAWGRVLLLPKQASGGSLALQPKSYFVNDLAKEIASGTVTVSNELDPMDRVRTRTTTDSTNAAAATIETHAYGDDSDEPIFTRSAKASAPATQVGWLRYVEDPTGDLAAMVGSGGSRALEFANIRGDTVAEAAATSTTTGLGVKFSVDEFGVPTGTSMTGRKYGFLGTKQRESLLAGQAVSMGVRTYSPWSGRFMQTDSVLGGSANTYDYANQDPINQYDVDGRTSVMGQTTRLLQALVKLGQSALKGGKAVKRGAKAVRDVSRVLRAKGLHGALDALAFSANGARVKAGVEAFALATPAGRYLVAGLRIAVRAAPRLNTGPIRLGWSKGPGGIDVFRISWASKSMRAKGAAGQAAYNNAHWTLGFK